MFFGVKNKINKKLFLPIFLIWMFLCSNISYATTMIVSDGVGYGVSYGYGGSSWSNMTSALNTAFGGAGNITAVANFDSATLTNYDAVWVDLRNENAQSSNKTLSATEITKLQAFINTGKKLVLIGENDSWSTWDNSILSVVGNSYKGFAGTGTYTKKYTHSLTTSVTSVYLPAGAESNGGTSLFNTYNFATLWGAAENVLVLLDINLWSGDYWSSANNSQFAQNVATWVANISDATAPTITSVSSDKANGSYKAGEIIDIDVVFSEAVTSTGNVTVTLETGDTDRTCTFTVSNSTTGTCNYTVQAGDTSADLNATISGTIADQVGNSLSNFTPTTSLSASKALVIDTANPTVSTYSPADSASNIATNANLILTFNENVDAESGNIVIYKSSDDSVFETISVASGNVTGSGTTQITLNPSGTFAEQTAYYVQIDATALDDTAGNSYSGISNATAWNFTVGDFTNPTFSTYSPTDDATDIAINANLVLTFSEAVDVESGNVVIYRSSDNSIFETIDVTSGNVTGSGTDTITINPTGTFAESTGFYVQIDATALDDTAGNSYAGISNATAWNFTTAASGIEAVEIEEVKYEADEDSITIKWETNNEADSRVKYGLAKNDLDQEKEDDDMEENHKIILKKLEPDTRYYFKIYSKDENDSEDSTKTYEIKTEEQKTIIQKISEFFQSAEESAGENEIQEENKPFIEERKYEPFEKVMEEKEARPEPAIEKNIISNVFKKDEKIILSEIKFRIVDEASKPIPNLPVSIHSEPQNGITDENGVVVFKNIETGNHKLEFAYQEKNFSKKLAISEPKNETQQVSIEVIEIVAKNDSLPVWVWGIISILSVLLLTFIFLYFKNKKK